MLISELAYIGLLLYAAFRIIFVRFLLFTYFLSLHVVEFWKLLLEIFHVLEAQILLTFMTKDKSKKNRWLKTLVAREMSFLGGKNFHPK